MSISNEIKKMLIEEYRNTNKDLTKVNLEKLGLTKKQAIGMLVYAKEWQKVEKQERVTKEARVTKQEMIDNINELTGKDFSGLIPASYESIKMVLEMLDN